MVTGSENREGEPAFEVRPLADADLDVLLEALDAEFGSNHDASWYEWKHRSGPWGASRGWVASDEDGPVGLRLFIPWRFVGADSTLSALRPCDTVTLPRARGRGVFSMMTRLAMDEIGDTVDLYFNTPNENSRPGYLKMGYTEWTRVPQRLGVVRRQSARLVDPIPEIDQTVLRTEATRAFLEWRYERCPRHDYSMHGLGHAATANGIVTRVRETRRVRVLVVSELWGAREEQEALVRALAERTGTSLVWAAGEVVAGAVASVRRGDTVVTRKDVAAAPRGPVRFSLGDVEDVI